MCSRCPQSLHTSPLPTSNFNCSFDGWCLANSDSSSTACVHLKLTYTQSSCVLQVQPGRAVELVPLPLSAHSPPTPTWGPPSTMLSKCSSLLSSKWTILGDIQNASLEYWWDLSPIVYSSILSNAYRLIGFSSLPVSRLPFSLSLTSSDHL